jgi:HEAT repeat protein
VDTVIVGAITADLSTTANDEPIKVVIAGHRGDEDTARAGLTSPDPSVRSAALGALARMGALTLSDMVALVDDPDPPVRTRAAEEAGRSPNVEARAVAAELLGDGDHAVVEMAAWALGEHAPREHDVDLLTAVATTHDDSLCREAAVAALGALGHPGGLAAILAATSDKATVRRRAVIALAPFSGPEVDAALVTALTDRDWQVRQAAEDLQPDPTDRPAGRDQPT